MKTSAIRVVLFALLTAAVAGAQRGGLSTGSGAGSTTSRAVSATVVSAVWAHDEDRQPVLEFAILLRGAPGWYVAEGPGTNGFNYRTTNGRTTNHTYATSGNVTVSIDTDSAVARRS